MLPHGYDWVVFALNNKSLVVQGGGELLWYEHASKHPVLDDRSKNVEVFRLELERNGPVEQIMCGDAPALCASQLEPETRAV